MPATISARLRLLVNSHPFLVAANDGLSRVHRVNDDEARKLPHGNDLQPAPRVVLSHKEEAERWAFIHCERRDVAEHMAYSFAPDPVPACRLGESDKIIV